MVKITITDQEVNAVKNLLTRSNYVNKQISYLKNTLIIEYDLEDAGFNIIKFNRLLRPETIKKLSLLDKKTKNIEIGKLQRRYPKLAKHMVSEFIHLRQEFAIANCIQIDDILSIKKDAIYLINKIAEKTKIRNYFNFRPKNKYTSYLYVNGKEFYFNIDRGLHVKGINKQIVKKQLNFFLKDIEKIMRMSEKLSKSDIISYLKMYRNNYLSLNLPIETYRNLDTGYFDYKGSQLEEIQRDMLYELDISHNYLYYLIPIIQNLI